MDRQHLDLIIDNIASEIEAFGGLTHPYILGRLRELRKIWNFSYYEVATSLDISYDEIHEVLRPKYEYNESNSSKFVVSGNLRKLKFVPVKIKETK